MNGPGRSFAAHLVMLARLEAAGEAANRSAGSVIAWVLSDLTLLGAHPTRPEVELVGGLRIAGERVGLNPFLAGEIAALGAALSARGACGIAVRGPIEREGVLALLRGLRTVPPEGDVAATQRWLDLRAGSGLRLLPLRAAGADVAAETDPESLKTHGRLWYAVAKARSSKTLARVPPEVWSAVRLLVERAEAEPQHHLALASLVDDDDSGTRACVHVAVLAIAIGQRLGLGRGDLVDLGIAALMAADMPELADDAAILGATLAQVHGSRPTASMLRRMLASWEHRMGVDFDGVPRRKTKAPLHLFSRIVAIARDYHLLTTGRKLRPDEALRALADGAGPRHDAALVQLLGELLGPWPVGSTVLLDTREVGVVCRAIPGVPPVVRIVVDGRGAVVRGGPLVRAGEGRRVVAMLDAGRLGIDPADALFG
jgi:hypothetical protein